MQENKYELSLSRSYVSSWGTQDAIREILQNAIDEQTWSGNEMEVNYENGKLSIKNYETSIPKSTLILGNGNKSEDSDMIGGFGEGYKLALLVLLRNGHNVTINNGYVVWTPSFEYSETFDSEVLVIHEESLDSVGNELEFIIDNLDEDYMEDYVYPNFPCIENDYGEAIETTTGEILLDKKFKGKMFVGGLFIQEDEDFKFGYNFYADEVRLDRDRKAINYYELKELTARSLVTAKGCNPAVFSAICDSYTDTQDMLDVIDDASLKFLSEYKDMYNEKHNIDDDVFVATEEVAKLYKEETSNEVFVGSELDAHIMARAKNCLSDLDRVSTEYSELTKSQRGWKNFKSSGYRQALIWIESVKEKLNETDINNFNDKVLRNVEKPSYYGEIRDIVDENHPESIYDDFVEEQII